jgi:hypothetical protein
MSNEYTLTWNIQLDADNPAEAAEQALAMMRDPHSTATIFRVDGPDGRTGVVDVEEAGNPLWIQPIAPEDTGTERRVECPHCMYERTVVVMDDSDEFFCPYDGHRMTGV